MNITDNVYIINVPKYNYLIYIKYHLVIKTDKSLCI